MSSVARVRRHGSPIVVGLLVALMLAAALTGTRTSAPFADMEEQGVELRSSELPGFVDGLVLWLDGGDPHTLFADVAGTTPAANGQAVARWTDKSLVGNDAVQSDPVSRPARDLSAIGFDGAEGLTVDAALLPTGSAPSTVFAVARLEDGAGGPAAILGHGTAFADGVRTVGAAAGRARHAGNGLASVTSGVWPSGSLGLVTAAFDGGLGLRADGGGPATGSATLSTGATVATVGGAPGVSPWTGSIAEVLVYDRILTAEERRSVERHLADEWGLVLAPVAPDSPVVTASGPGTLTLSWSAPSDEGGSAVTDYVVQYRAQGSASWTTLADGTSTATAATVSGLPTGTVHELRVAAVNAAGAGDWSAVTSAQTLAAWTPADLPGGLELWLDADAADTFTLDAGNAVSQWRDRSGNSRHGSQTLTARPTRSSTMNGRSSVSFDGTNDFLSLASPLPAANGGGFDIAIAAAPEVAGRNGTWGAGFLRQYPGGDAAGSWYVGYRPDARPSVVHHAAAGNNGGGALRGDAAFTNGVPQVLGYTYALSGGGTSSSQWTMRVNGSAPLTVATGSTATGWNTGNGEVGRGWTNGDYHVLGRIGEIVMTSGTLTPEDRARLEGYLAHRWGTQASLPEGHPYRSTPPLTVAPAAVPSAPGGLAGTGGNRTVTLTWNAPASSRGTPVRDYVVQHRPAGSLGAWTTFVDGVAAATTVTVTGLTNGAPTELRVLAVNAAGTGEASGVVTVTPRTIPAAPAAFVVDRAIVSDLAGSGTAGSADGTGATAGFTHPDGIELAPDGNLYVVDSSNHRIRRVTAAGVVTTFAGSGTAGGVDGSGTAAGFSTPARIAADPSGNLYVTEPGAHRIRRITPAGIVTTFAGSGAAGGEDGSGTAASFHTPVGIATDPAGNVYVAEFGGHRIRRITPGGVVSTLAGSGSPGGSNGTGTAASFDQPNGLAVDAAGNVYVAESAGFRIRRITPAGVVTTFAGSGTSAHADGTGTAASFVRPTELDLGAAGNLYLTEWTGQRVRRITPAGVVTTVAGTGAAGTANGPAAGARFDRPVGIAAAPDGTLYLTDHLNHRVRTVTPSGSGTLAVQWAAPVDDGGAAITDYLIEYRTSPSGSWTALGDGVSTATSVTITGLTDGTAYDVQVSAVNVAGAGTPTTALSGTPSTVPGAPSGLAVTPGDGHLTVSWNAPSTAGGTAITDYRVEVRTSPSGPWTVATDGVSAGTTATVNGLVNGTAYDVRVLAGNANGLGPASSSATATPVGPPGAPTGVTATAAASSIGVSWTAPADDGGSPITGYTVTATPGVATCSTDNSAITTRTYADNGGWQANGLGTLGYVLAGYDGAADRASLPAGVSYTRTNTLMYTWQGSTNETRAVQDPVGGSRRATTWFSGGAFSQSFTFASATSRTMRIYALDWDTNSRVQTVDVSVGGVTRSVVISSFSAGRWIEVPISVAAGGTVTITTTRTAGANGVIAGVFFDPPPTSCTITGLTPGTPYSVSVTATNALGTGPAGAASGTATPYAAPAAPTITGTTPGNGEVTVSWNPGSDNGSAVTSWQVTAYTDATGTVAATGMANPQTVAGAGAGSLTFTGLTNGTDYRFRVAGVNAAGTGAASAVSAAVTPAEPPGAPSGLAADRVVVSTVAGSGVSSFADGTGTAAVFSGLRGVARDGAGNVFVAERNNHRIRRISPAGVVTTHAGNGTTAVLNDPYGVAVAPDGTVYVAEFNGHRIRRVDVNGTVTTLAGSGAAGSADGTGTAASFNNPTNLVLDAAGDLYVAEYGGHRIRRITPSGVVTTFAGSGVAGSADGTGAAATFNGPTGLRFDALGNLYVTDQISGLVRRVTPAGVVTTVPGGTGFATPLGVEVDAVGNLYVTEWGGHRIRRITPGGVVSVVAGTGTSGGANGPGSAAMFASPAGILLEPDGTLLVTEGGGNRVRRLSPVGSGSLAVAWTAPTTTGGSPITDYLVEYRTSPSGPWTTFADGVSTDTATTITGLVDGTTYDMRISALNAAGTGSPSAAVTRTPSWTPAAPTGLTLTPGIGSLEATWAAPADTGGSAITDYLVEFRTSPSGSWTVVPDGISTATSATITGLTATETYDVRITAANANGPGVPTTATATVPTGSAWTPSDLTTGPVLWLDASDTTSLTLNGSSVRRWTDRAGRTIRAEQATATSQPTRIASAMNGLPVLRFDGGDWFQIAHDASLEPGNNLTFVAVVRMAATNGRYSIYHTADNNQAGHFWIEGGTGGVYPVGYSVAVPNFFQSAAAVTASPAADLVVYRRNGIGATHSWRVAGQTRTALAPTTDQPYVASSRPKMVGARYTTGAQGFLGDMAELLLIPATLSDADAELLEGYLAHKWGLTAALPADHPYKVAAPQSPRPSEPTSVTANPGAQQLTVTWNAPTIAGTSAVSDYVVQYRTAPSGSWSTFVDGISTATTTTITGLTDGTTYDIRVAAVNAMGMGPWSASTTATTPVPAYGAAVTATGPLAYWRFGSESGGVVPLAAGGGASFPMAACTPIAQTTSPFAGSAVGLTGAAYGFTAPSIVTSGPFTVEFWYRPTANNPVPISFSRSGGMMSLYHSTANWFGFNVGAGDVYGATAPALNEWTHVVARFPNGPLSEARLFLNGVEQTLAQRQGSTPATYPTATTTAWFGSFGAGHHVVAGHLGELAFYPASVDPASVAAHASITDAAAYRAAVDATGPASYWRFDRHASAAVPLAAGTSGSFPLTTNCRVRTLSPFADAWFGLVGMSHAFTAPNDVATGPFTAEFWMRPTAYGGAPLSFGSGAAGGTPALLLDANGFGFTSGSGDVWGAPAPALNTWTHVAARFPNGDRSGARLFLNGVEQTLTQRVGATPATLPMAATAARFGALGASTNVFAGTLAELAVYPAAVDPAVVAAHAAATAP